MGDILSGVVLGIGAPNRTSDGRAVQCAIVLGDEHGLSRIYADFDGSMNRIRVWDVIECEVYVNTSDSRPESWKLDSVSVRSKVKKSHEKRRILDSSTLSCGDDDPIDFLNRNKRSVAVIRQSVTGIGYGMDVRRFDESPDWVTAQRETPQKPYVWWESTAGKKHHHQLCAHEAYEWLRKNPSNTSQLWSNLHIEDIEWTKWLLVGNTKDRRNSWVVVHVHRLLNKSDSCDLTLERGRGDSWPYLPIEDLRSRRKAVAGQKLLFAKG